MLAGELLNAPLNVIFNKLLNKYPFFVLNLIPKFISFSFFFFNLLEFQLNGDVNMLC